MDAISCAAKALGQKLPNTEIKIDEPLKKHTSFKIGGPVRLMLFPACADDLVESFKVLSESGITPYIIGNGSNILAVDSALDIVVINTSKLNGIGLVDFDVVGKQTHSFITAEAGALLSKLAVYAYENELTGLEFAHGIPGTLGGAVVMNAGAYSGEMKDVVIETTAFDISAGLYTLTAQEHEFAYRHSRFSDTGDVVLSSVIRLEKGDKISIKQKMDELSVRRRESQPLDLPSGGSTFKRPAEGYASAMIEQSGLKGYTVGGAQVSQKHSGFIVNRGDATFADTMAVIEHVQEVVLRQFGVELELEVKVIHS